MMGFGPGKVSEILIGSLQECLSAAGGGANMNDCLDIFMERACPGRILRLLIRSSDQAARASWGRQCFHGREDEASTF